MNVIALSRVVRRQLAARLLEKETMFLRIHVTLMAVACPAILTLHEVRSSSRGGEDYLGYSKDGWCLAREAERAASLCRRGDVVVCCTGSGAL